MKFKFGDRVLISARLIRVHKSEESQWEQYKFPNPVEAIYLKRITLANGKMEDHERYTMDGPEYERYFVSSKTIPGAWICRKGFKPEKVFLEDIEEIK